MNQSRQVDRPDVRQLQRESLPESAFPGGRKQTFRIFIEPEVHRRVWQHAIEDVSVEICGVLVGKWARDPDGPFALISECIRGEAASSKFAEVTFTHETWAKINREMDTRFSQLVIVGWYHSHPGFGVFLSERDTFIQEHFFSGSGQLAHVVDPIRKNEGIFFWHEGKPTPCPHYWVGDQLQTTTTLGRTEESAASPMPISDPQREGRRSGPLSGVSSGLSVLKDAALLVAAFLIGFLLAGRLTDLERLRIEQGAMARSWLFLKVRPGLREEMDKLAGDLSTAAGTARALAKDHLKHLSEPEGTETKWKETLNQLDRCTRLVATIEATYCMSPEEAKLFQALGETKREAAGEDQARPEGQKPKAEAEKPIPK
jgi:proteasome lid subunit RPN8/RPN11